MKILIDHQKISSSNFFTSSIYYLLGEIPMFYLEIDVLGTYL